MFNKINEKIEFLKIVVGDGMYKKNIEKCVK